MSQESTVRQLARLTVRAQNLGERSSGGIGGITPMDIAAACAGVDEAAYLLLLRIWAHDGSVKPRLFYVLYNQAMGIATREKWKLPTGSELIRKMTSLALDEVCSPGLCKKCSGKGELWLRSLRLPAVCERCQGTGKMSLSNKEKAASLGLSLEDFKNWESRYEKIYYLVQDAEADGLNQLGNNLRW